MTAKDLSCDADAFATTLAKLVGDPLVSCTREVGKAVEQTTRYGVKQLKGPRTEGIGRDPTAHPWSDEYRKGFGSHVSKGAETTSEIGNRNKPGLVHLLEKGHRTLKSRRTQAYPHMAPTFDDMLDYIDDRLGPAVDRALRG